MLTASLLPTLLEHVPVQARASIVLNAFNNLAGDPDPGNAEDILELRDLIEHATERHHDCNAACDRTLLNFFLRCIQCTSDAQSLSVLASQVQQRQDLSQSILAVIVANFKETACKSSVDLQTKGETTSYQADVPRQETGDSHILSYLRYLKILCWLPSYQPPWLEGEMLLSLTLLIATPDATIRRVALETAHVYLTSVRPGDEKPASNDLVRTIWLTISAMLIASKHNRDHNAHRTSGLSLWLSLLSSEVLCGFQAKLINQSEYYMVLKRTLNHGTPEQQKLALSIFRLSADSRSKEYFGGISSPQERRLNCFRFATIYETIILVGYLNQVEESLPQLNPLVTQPAPIEPWWIVCLLNAVFQPRFQDNVKALVAKWVLTSSQGLLTRAGTEGSEFLRRALLPWAASGPLYIASISYDDDLALYCRHGDDVVRFLADSIVAAADRGGLSRWLTAILQYLVDQRHKITQYARAYVLEGFLEGLKHADVRLDEECLRLVSSIASVTGFVEVGHEYMSTLLQRISSFSHANGSKVETIALDTSSTNAGHINSDASMLQKPEQPSEETLSPEHAVNHHHATAREIEAQLSVQSLYEEIKASACNSLSGNGLMRTCIQLREAHLAQKANASIDPEHLTFILKAVWDEVEIQEYPRRVLMALPGIVLHPTYILCTMESPELIGLLTAILDELKDLSRNRPYVFSQLAQAWYTILMRLPDMTPKLPLQAFLLAFAQRPPPANAEFEMETIIANKMSKFVPSRSYEYYHGLPQSMGYAIMFSMLAGFPNDPDYPRLCRQLLDSLLAPWVALKASTPVFAPWKSTTQLQVLVILNEQILPHLSTDAANDYLTKYLHILSLEQHPRYRYLFEWIITRLCHHHPPHRHTILTTQSAFDIANPKFAASLIKLTFVLAQLPDTPESFATELSTQLIVLAASIRISVRHEAHWTIPKLHELALSRGWRSITTNDAFNRLNAWIRGLEIFATPPSYRYFDGFDAIENHNLTHLTSGAWLEIEPKALPSCRHQDFIRVAAIRRSHNLPDPETVIPVGAPSPPRPRPPVSATKPVPIDYTTIPAAEIAAPLQTKSTLDPLIQTATGRPTPLLIVASLVASATNLGGLSRMAEVNGAHTLYVADTAVAGKKDFTSLSVSSHLHLPIKHLPVAELVTFLRARKREGYEVVGIEQTDASRVLGSAEARFQGDGKTVLLLGSEREGIPGTLLGECDWCVEVRQRGVTRSMNVQTAAGVVCWEWGRQWEGEGRPRGVVGAGD